jgi:hypothetical protein
LKYDSFNFSNVVTGLGSGTTSQFVNVTPIDNRLMLLAFSGLSNTDGNSTVMFSNAGQPESYTATNFVQLTPGDGESIRGVCNFGNQIFVFKESKFFVFTGPSTNSAGQPIFNYRIVNSGIGIHPVGVNAGCVATPFGRLFLRPGWDLRHDGRRPGQDLRCD